MKIDLHLLIGTDIQIYPFYYDQVKNLSYSKEAEKINPCYSKQKSIWVQRNCGGFLPYSLCQKQHNFSSVAFLSPSDILTFINRKKAWHVLRKMIPWKAS